MISALSDAVEFNRRLHRAIALIEEQIAPHDEDDEDDSDSPDDLFANF